MKFGYIIVSAVCLGVAGCGNARYLGPNSTYVYAPVKEPVSYQQYASYTPSSPSVHTEPQEPTTSYEYDYGLANEMYGAGEVYTPPAQTPEVYSSDAYSAEVYSPSPEVYEQQPSYQQPERTYPELTEEGVVDEYFEYVYGDEDLKGI